LPITPVSLKCMTDTLQYVVDCTFSHSAPYIITTTTIQHVHSQGVNLQYSEGAHFPSK
jgi:hypothetical protein